MKYAKCECKDCKLEFMISFDGDLPPFKLSCIFCKSDNISYSWIDKSDL